jgi:hypothetical protein
MDVNRLLDETVERSTNIDGWLSRKASLKIQKATGKNLPEFVKKNMKGMTEAQRNLYRKKLLAQRKAQASRKKARQDAQNKMKQAVIQRKIRNANLLSSWKERKKQSLKRKALARARMMTQRKLAQRDRKEQQALAVRNATNPGAIKAKAERQRVMVGRRKSSEIMNGRKDKFTPGIEQRNVQSRNVRHLMRKRGKRIPVTERAQVRARVRALTDEQRIERCHKMIEKINERIRQNPKLAEKGQFMIEKLRNRITKLQKKNVAGFYGLGEIPSTQMENVKATLKRHFLETVARSRGTTDPSDKMNIMRQFWDRWQPVMATNPGIYNWFKSDQHIRNAMLDFKGIGDWDEFTPAEAQYLQGTTTDEERSFLLGERPGEVNAYTSMHPLADNFDVEDLMPNVPAPQPNVGDIGDFTSRFDVEELSRNIPTIDPVNAQLPDWSRRGNKPIRGNWRR